MRELAMPSAMPSRMVRQIADGNAFGEQDLQDALNAGHRDQARHQVLDQVGLLLWQFLEKLLHFAIGEQLRHVALEQLGQMRGEHGGGVDHRVALHRGFFFQCAVDPCRRQAECRLGGMCAGQLHLAAGGVHDHELAGPDLAAAGFDLFHLDDVGIGVELDIVEDAHGRHDEAHFGRKRPAQRLDLLGQAIAAVRRVDQRQQRVAKLDLEIVDLERGGDRLVGGGGLGV